MKINNPQRMTLVGLNKKFVMFFLIGILLISFGSAYMRSSNIQYAQFDSGTGGQWKADRSMCEAGQDFLIQITPFGCTPAVVRSDLLEEQNVPIFCQLGATKINPLIEVDAIEHIGFSGKYPEEVSGIGFHPARAALGVESDLNSPILNNIGYVVIVLKKQSNASAMPEYVTGNLTAEIRYDIKNAFGIGKASFYLSEMSDDDWEDKHIQYGFWNGKGYLRAEGVDNEGARISVYDDTRKISSVDLDKGEISKDIYLPGFDCLAGLKLKLDGLEAPDTRAKLDINGEIVEVAEGEKFLENRCQVKDIDKKGLVQEVDINCKGDDKRKTFELRISPKIELEIGGVKGEYSLGDKLPSLFNDPKKDVYLGFIGTEGDTEKKKDLYVRFVQAPYHENKLSDGMLSEVVRYDGDSWNAQKGGYLAKTFKMFAKASVNWVERFSRYLVQGTEISNKLKFDDGKKLQETYYILDNVYGINVKIIGFAGAVDKNVEGDIKKNYESAIKDYDTIIQSFSSEKIQDGMDKITYGEEALYQKILLAEKTGQKKTMLGLCKEFNNLYPDSKKNLKTQCEDAYKLSSSEISSRDVSINGIVKRISFDGVYEPSEEEYSAEITISNAEDCSGGVLQKNEETCFSDSEFIILKELHDDYALFDVSSVKESTLREVAWKKDYLKIKLNELKVIGEKNYQIKLTKINLKKQAKVSVIPNIDNAGTEANFSFRVGIEQRSIKLSPEKTREKIEQLNKTIEEWEDKSEQLGKIVKGLKGACLATGAFLTVKNFFANTGGKSIARQEIMSDIWYPRCTDLVADGTYKTINECLTEEADNIDKAVDDYHKIIEDKNKEFENLQKGITETDWLGERTIDDRELAKKVFTDGRKNNLVQNLEDNGISEVEIDGEQIGVLEIVNMADENTFSITSFRDLEVMATASGSTSLKEMADKQIKTELTNIYRTNRERVERTNIFDELKQSSLNLGVTSYGDKDSIVGTYSGGTILANQINTPTTLDDKDEEGNTIKYPAEVITYNSKKYVVILGGAGTSYVADKVYEYGGVVNGVIQVGEERTDISDKFNSFKKYDSSTYENPYKSSIGETTPCLRYYETEPYKGLPAVVPFDLKKGWYAWVGQTLPVFGGIKSYDESGRVTSFWVCNIGENGIEENKAGDDICQMINTGTGQPYNKFGGLSDSEAARVIRDAKEAVEEASRKSKSASSGKRIMINGQSVRICKPAVDIPEMQCQSFMSPKDCQLLFNVCDPVVCPSSRCNFGGTYHVKDVIQSGIIGSIVLCLPNFSPDPMKGTVIPVCLTGIKAGIDGLLSVYHSYRDCLQESLDTGKMVGICDEIYSIHLCEFFWRQSLPLAKIIIPKMIEIAMGQNVRGGGEYLGVANAWTNAEQSIDYFAQYYAASSYEAFKGRIIEGVGDAVCQNSISASYPDGGGLLDSLTEPDSPPQFHGRFDEIKFTTATNPPISHYKVFYHIYAGKESRAYYKVYLKSPPGTSFYQDTPIRYVASGYIATGGYATETKDFTAPSGYKELCIMVNNQEECGFKQVSTSYAVDYVNDKYMEEQASERDIKSEQECIGGSVSAYSLLSPSLEGAAEEIINPAIYNRGIIRICATESPGKATDGKWDGEGARWIEVGNCGQENIKCWLDKESVENVIKHEDIEDKVLEEHTKSQLEILKSEGDYFKEGEFDSLIEKKVDLLGEGKYREVIDLVNSNLVKAFFNSEKVQLLLNRAKAFGELAGEEKSEVDKKATETTTGTVSSDKEEYCEKFECIASTSTSSELSVMGGDCHLEIGREIMKIAKKYKTSDTMFDDEQFLEDVGTKNFECFVLQLAMQESCLAHCVYEENQANYDYCDGISDKVVKGDAGHSIGVMQLSDAYFDEDRAIDFEWNVEEGVKHLIRFYNSAPKSYECKGVNYEGWQRALRHYNGWNTDCSQGDKDYVGNVLGQKDEIENLFPECGE